MPAVKFSAESDAIFGTLANTVSGMPPTPRMILPQDVSYASNRYVTSISNANHHKCEQLLGDTTFCFARSGPSFTAHYDLAVGGPSLPSYDTRAGNSTPPSTSFAVQV